VWTKTLVEKVEFDEHQRATGVRYRVRGKVGRVEATREVVISAGTILSPKLLQLSGVGPAEVLRSHRIEPIVDSFEVGRNLHEHPYAAMSYAVNTRTLNQELKPWFAIKHGLEFLLRGSGPLTSSAGHVLVFGHLRGGRRPDYQIIFAPFGFRSTPPDDADVEGEDETAYQALARRRARYQHDVHAMQLARISSVTAYPSALHPSGRGTVTIASADPQAPPVIRYQLLGGEPELLDLIAACRAARAIFGSPSMARHVVAEELPGPAVQTDGEWREYLKGFSFRGNHPVGTCRMGSDPDSVVGPDLRVRGVEGLRVIDASVMPSIPSAPTNAATVMIAEKGAEMIRTGARGVPGSTHVKG
jgi:choline dehydrogenase-like flavoprotein